MSMNVDLVARAISYHGLPLQKMWESERGNLDLVHIGISYPDYSMYQARQKYLTFQDRAKRLKLHQFIAKKAPELYDSKLVDANPKRLNLSEKEESEIVRMAPFEVFLNVDILERQKHFFQTIKPGDIIYGMVINTNNNGLIVKPICATGSIQRFVGDIGIKALIMRYNLVPVPNKGTDKYSVNDYVCCEVLEVVPDACKLILGMKGEFPRTDNGPPLGLITTDNFPDVYKTAAQIKGQTYSEVLDNSQYFNNPRTEELLYEELGLDFKYNYTNMSGLRGRFPDKEYATELRQTQASKWAFRSVAEGIEHFKEGRHSEAFQCLNKALSMDPRNVEGLVARGALYANSGSFKKAVDDFESALKLNSNHANARRYLGETLVALGRNFEEENKFEDAKKAYQDCLKVVPNHEEAYNSLEYLKNRYTGKQIVEPNELELPPLNLNKPLDNKLDDKRDDRKDKKSKKDKKKRNKKRRSSSSESSSSTDSSDSSSSDSSTSDSSSDSDAGRNKRKKSKSEVSPFSQRMGDFTGGPSDPFAQFGAHSSNSSFPVDDYESKVRKFIEMTRDDDDYEDKVRKFVAEAAKYQKERKNSETKEAKKKKRKEEKKAKKESKKKRKKEKHSKKKDKHNLEDIENKKIREALKIFENLPVLDDLGAKLSEIYNKKTQSQANASNKAESSSVSSTSSKKLLGESYDKVAPPASVPVSKWKMMFPKDDGHVPQISALNSIKLGATTSRLNRFDQQALNDKQQDLAPEDTRVPILPPQARTGRKMPSPLGPYGRATIQRSPPGPPPPVKSGPVVLDKFGNFRLANVDPTPIKPPEPVNMPHSRSRSRGRYRRSRSSTRSRSRSRLRSLGRRSRSRSLPRYRGGFRGGRRFGNQMSRSRSHSRSASPVSLYRRGPPFRGRGARGGRFMRPTLQVRPPRHNRFLNRQSSHSLSPIRDGPMSSEEQARSSRNTSTRHARNGSSPEKKAFRDTSRGKSERKKDDAASKKDDTKKDDRKRDSDKKDEGKRDRKRDDRRANDKKGTIDSVKDEGKKKEPPPPGTDADLMATEKLLDVARRERKEDMITRNPDLVKKPSDAF